MNLESQKVVCDAFKGGKTMHNKPRFSQPTYLKVKLLIMDVDIRFGAIYRVSEPFDLHVVTSDLHIRKLSIVGGPVAFIRRALQQRKKIEHDDGRHSYTKPCFLIRPPKQERGSRGKVDQGEQIGHWTWQEFNVVNSPDCPDAQQQHGQPHHAAQR